MEPDVTVVLTSSNRPDLLFRTLTSFLKYNTYTGIKELIIYEDTSQYPDILKTIEFPFPVKVIFLGVRIGQLLAIDIAYTHVTTNYIFHCEDDWEFYHSGFIEYSKFILETNPQVLQVHLRELPQYVVKENGIHPSKKFAYLSASNNWCGFSFNPGLKRFSDYTRLTSYAKQVARNPDPMPAEQYIGHVYTRLGYVGVVLLLNDGQGFIKHIGEERHIQSLLDEAPPL